MQAEMKMPDSMAPQFGRKHTLSAKTVTAGFFFFNIIKTVNHLQKELDQQILLMELLLFYVFYQQQLALF